MDPLTMAALGKAGAAAAIALAAVGSAMGTGVAGMAAVGAWKKCYIQDKTAPFLLLIFIGAPLSQTIYGMILMNTMARMCSITTYLPPDALAAAQEAAAAAAAGGGVADWMAHVPPEIMAAASAALKGAALTWPAMLAAGILGGLAMAMSAVFQGRAGAAGADALAETGQGFGNYLMTIGVVETVALFVLVFIQTAIR
jgi:V/A-type H+-transporting ATPase subunit K